MIAEVRRCLHHAPGVARRAHATALAGIGHEVVVPAVTTPGPSEAVGEDPAFQILAKRLTDIRLGGVVVALAIELACAGEFMSGLEVLGDGLVEQRTFGVARVVEFGLACRCSWYSSRRAATRKVVRMGPCVQLGCRRVHGANP
jgi:hypothetical protein